MSDNTNTSQTRTRGLNGWMISTIIFAILFIGTTISTIVLAVNYARSQETITYEAMVEDSKSTEEILENDLDVSIDQGSYTVTSDEDGDLITSLIVEAKNKSSERHSFSIHIEATNEDGSERLAEDYLALENLAAGQSQENTVFNSLTPEQAEQLKSAKFNVVDVYEY